MHLEQTAQELLNIFTEFVEMIQYLACSAELPRIAAELQLYLIMSIINLKHSRELWPRIVSSSSDRGLWKDLECCDGFCSLEQKYLSDENSNFQ